MRLRRRPKKWIFKKLNFTLKLILLKINHVDEQNHFPSNKTDRSEMEGQIWQFP